MTDYTTTRPFPATLAGHVDNLIPRHCRSIRMEHNDNGTCALTAHRSEIASARLAIRLARDAAATAHIR